MKATLKFMLPEEQSDFDLALNGHKYHSALESTLALIRSKLKSDITQTAEEVLEEIRGHIHEEMQ